MPRRNRGPKLHWRDNRKVWEIVYCQSGRSRQRSTGTDSREDAEAFFGEWLRKRGQHGGPSDPAEIFVTDVLNDYATARAPKVAAPRRMLDAVTALIDFWEGMRVADITPKTCDLYSKKRGRAPGTIRYELKTLRTALAHAWRYGMLARQVMVELPPEPESKARFLSRSEAARLLRASRTPQTRLYLPLFILIGLYTGRRAEAVLSLRWPQVDLAAARINFETGRVRTKKRRGLVPIPPRLLPHLKRARRRGSDLGPVLHLSGRPLKDVAAGFAGACQRAGLSGVTPHTLRHTAATWLMQGGVDAWQVAGFLSMSLATLTRVYGHHHPDFMQDAALSIGTRGRGLAG